MERRRTGASLRVIIIGLCIIGLSFAAGLIFASRRIADTGDLLGLAGALVGAAASVWGAFAVARHSVERDRREAEDLVFKFLDDLNAAMSFLDKVQRRQPVEEDPAETDQRIDRILVTVPRMTKLLVEERLASQTRRARYMGAVLRFVYEVERCAPSFEEAADKRRQFKVRQPGAPHLVVDVPPEIIATVKRACETALGQLQTGGKGIAPLRP